MPQLNHRVHERLREYWESLRKGRTYPSENEIDTDAIADIWPRCFLISIDEVTKRLGYRYSYLGHELVEAYGDDTGNPDVVMQLLSTMHPNTAHKFDEVLQTRAPVIDESQFTNLKNIPTKYRTCMLPLGYDDKEVSHIIGSMSWKTC